MFSLKEWAQFIVSVSDDISAVFLIVAGVYMIMKGYNNNYGYVLVTWGFGYLTGKSNPKQQRKVVLGNNNGFS